MSVPFGNAVFSYQDWVSAAGASIAASAEVTNMPGARVATMSPFDRWRILATTGSITIDFGQDRACDVFIAVQPWDAEDAARNYAMLDPADLVRWKLGTTAGAGDVYDSGTIACGIQPGYGLTVHFPPAAKTGRYLTFSFTSSGTTTHTDWGRIWSGPIVEMGIKPALSSAFPDEWTDGSTVTVAPRSGVAFIDLMPQARKLDFSFEFMTTAEGQATIKELRRVAGIRGQVFCTRDPVSAYINTEAMLALITRTAPITWSSNAAGHEFSTPFSLLQTL